MPIFTTEQNVRDKFQLTDTTLVSSALVTASIGDAHTELLRMLDPLHDTASPPDLLILGETCLAGAHLLRTLAAKTSVELRHLSIGGKRIQPGDRFPALNATAAAAAEDAWRYLEPYLLPRTAESPLAATDSIPVLGESRTK